MGFGKKDRKSSLPAASRSASFIEETLEYVNEDSSCPPSTSIQRSRASLDLGPQQPLGTPPLQYSPFQETVNAPPQAGDQQTFSAPASPTRSRDWSFGLFRKAPSHDETNSPTPRASIGEVDDVDDVAPVIKSTAIVFDPILCVVPEENKEAVAQMAEQFKKFFSKRPSLGDDMFGTEETAWKPPESWASEVDFPRRATDSLQATAGSTEAPGQDQDFWAIRVFKPMDKQDARFSSLVENSGHTFVTVACTLSTTAAELCRILSKKFSSSRDLDRFRLFVRSNGTERLMAHEERPVAMLKNWLEVIGYREGDQLQKIAREDHSYLCRFIFHEFPPAPLTTEQLEQGKRLITAKSALLPDLNLSVIPVGVFKNAETMEFLDLSHNTLLDFPDDLFEGLKNLKLLKLEGNLLTSVPKAIIQSHLLNNLDLSSNNLTGYSLTILQHCTNLTNLKLACNQIVHFPDELRCLTRMRTLDLSSNYLEVFPAAILAMPELKLLNLEFNLLTAIPDEISKLSKLINLGLTGNRISYIPYTFEELYHLQALEIRGNLMEELGGLGWVSSAKEVSISHNNLFRLNITSWNSACSILASNNKISSITFMQRMEFLRSVDLRVNKLIGLPEDIFEYTPYLEHLNLARNSVTALPQSINVLSQLTTLVISDNQITDLNIDFAALPKLAVLDAHSNNIKAIHASIWKAPALKTLNLSSNFISALPDQSFSFAGNPLVEVLEELYLAENNLTDAAMDELYQLGNLRLLNISQNQIFDLGDDIDRLTKLTDLYVSGNSISRIPEGIESLQQLERFFINGNKLSNIPYELASVRSLLAFDVSSNNLKFNVANWPYDWNWNYNPDLQYLDMSNNKRLDLNPPNISPENRNLTSFKALPKLRLLNLTGLKSSDNIPREEISLRVRTDARCEHLRIAAADFCGRDVPVFDKFDTFQNNFLDQESDFYAGFFDGRGSDVVSYYLKDSLTESITFEMQRLKSEEDVPNALRRSFLSCNRDLSMQPTQLCEGSTATVAYFMEGKMFLANVGDSMAVISRDGQAVIATEKHHSWNRAEQSRIRNLGGEISSFGLVEQELPITRGFGYHHMVPYVNANPFVKCYDIGPAEEFVIIASQSFWKQVRYQAAVDIARGYRDNPELAAQRLRDTALAYGCSDSMTVVFICLRNFGTVQASAAASNQDQPGGRRRRLFRGSVEDRTLARLAAEIPPPKPPCAIVFTDIRESTRLWSSDPNAMRAANKIHNQIIRRLLRHHRGYEVKNEGDAFMVVFETVLDAMKWCRNVQLQLLEAEWPQEVLNNPICAPIFGSQGNLLYRGLAVRMGIHYGTAISEQDIVTRRMDYFGVEVITASRICDAALGGQLIVTTAVRETVQKEAEAAAESVAVSFFQIGATKLKGLENLEVVYAVYPDTLAERLSHPLSKL